MKNVDASDSVTTWLVEVIVAFAWPMILTEIFY